MKSSLKLAMTLLLATALGTTAASAADLINPTVPRTVDNAVSYASPTNDMWTGFYAGGHVGGGFVNGMGNDRDLNGGIQAGYNQQFEQFVIGAEVDGGLTNRLQYQLGAGGVLEQTWSGSAKARAGLAMDNILLFATVGVNVARLEGKGTVTSGDRWQAGLAFGGGVEVALHEKMSGKLEYTQTRFNNVQTSVAGIGRQDNLVNHAVKAGFNFHF